MNTETLLALNLLVRFWSKVNKRSGRFWNGTECWEWVGGRTGEGYGSFSLTGGKHILAHRFAHELLIGPIPAGRELDHLCRWTPCINPAHTEPVTHRVNMLRGIGPVSANARKTHCRHGHPFDTENTGSTPSGGRYCRRCNALKAARRYEKVKVCRMEARARGEASDG